jgi:hypothetical protein
MADQDVYTQEELENMSRLVLRRICKGRGMSSEDCSKMEFEDMVAWIVENQEGGGGGSSKKAAPKAGGKKAPPKAAPKAGGKKAPPKAPPKGKKAPPKAAPKDDETGEVSGDDLANAVLEAIGELKDRLSAVEEKVDTLGEVVDTNIATLVEDVGELRADSYKALELSMHFFQWARADGILTDDGAPEGLDFEDKAAAIDEECAGGNDEGDE